jgi:MFS family permease
MKLSSKERALAVSRLKSDSIASRNPDNPRFSSWQAFCVAISNWRVWLLVIGYMVIVGSSTLSYFYPTLVKGLGYTSHKAQYMVVPIYSVAFLAVASTGYFMDKIPEYRGLVIAIWLTISLVCSISVCLVYNFTARYILLVFMASGLWASNGLALSYASSTFAPMQQDVRAISLALVNAFGNLAQIYGAFLFPSTDAPKYLKGFGVVRYVL